MANMTPSLSRNGLLVRVGPPRRNDKALLTARPGLDPEAQPLKDRVELLAAEAFCGIDADDQNAGRSQEVHEPVQRGFERLHRVQLPIDESGVVLTAWKAAGGGRHHAVVATA